MHIDQGAGRNASATLTKMTGRRLGVGFAAALLLSCSSLALHADTSNAQLAKEIAELKAQIYAMKGSIKKVKATRSPVVVAAPAPFVIPEGATPVFVNANKSMQFGSLTITPGGYVQADGFYRTKSLQSDVTSAYNSIPFNNSTLAHVGEGRTSIRQSRAALLVESPISTNAIVAGYGEFDLNAAGASSNNNQTNSYVPRVRQLYATLDYNEYGMHFLAGQAWSLVTLNSKGITPRNEVVPSIIDSGLIAGFEYGRIPQVRLVKDFNKKLWLAISVEAPGTVTNGCPTVVSNSAALTATPATLGTNSSNVVCSAVGNGSYGAGGDAQSITFNKIPDVVGKVAYEQVLSDRTVHYEATGIYRNFLANNNYGAVAAGLGGGFNASSTQSTNGYGIGAALIMPIIPGKLDGQISGLYGYGLGKYTSSGLPDTTINAIGQLKAIQTSSALVGLTYHATPSIDIFGYGGFEQVGRTISNNALTGAQVGYGLTIANNTGCAFEGGACNGTTHRVYQGTVGVIDKLYKGPFGLVTVAVNYSYVVREAFAAQATNIPSAIGTTNSAFIKPTTSDNIVFTSLRYFPFQ